MELLRLENYFHLKSKNTYETHVKDYKWLACPLIEEGKIPASYIC